MGTRTLDEFHRTLAALLVNAKNRHDARPGPGQPGYLGQDSQDAVTIWRRIAHIAHSYANGEDVKGRRPTWADFWEDGLDLVDMITLVTNRSRYNRCGDDLDASLVDDSVKYWEYGLVLSVVRDDVYAEAARRNGNAEAARRLMLETETGLAVITAYTGADARTVRDALHAADGKDPEAPGYAGGARTYPTHPLLDMIAANRPVR